VARSEINCQLVTLSLETTFYVPTGAAYAQLLYHYTVRFKRECKVSKIANEVDSFAIVQMGT
jgi:hypothetical protein